ncbi:MAG: sugar kinase [Solirubrobacterales bacterium]|nr:sugar kinase [Solirubrobacterales bacterium]
MTALGEAMLRLSPPGLGRLRTGGSFDVHVAGAEANVAVALASLGVGTRYVTSLPDNPLGERVCRDLRAAGVDLEYVETVDRGRLGIFFVEFGAGARPSEVWYDRADSTFSQMDGYRPDCLDGVRLALTSGITLAVSPTARHLAERFVADAAARGVGVCLDVNYRERLSSPEEARESIESVLPQAEIVVCSRLDARRVFGIEADDTSEVAAEFGGRFAPKAKLVVVTDGENGCVGICDDQVLTQEAIPAEPVVDRIGAGDAFLAGLVTGFVEGRPVADSLRLAAAMGALKCSVAGDQALFDRDEVGAVVEGKAGFTR